VALIEIDRLTKAFGFMPALRGVTLAVERGESVALLGANGSGKSNLLRILSGLSKPSSGMIRVGGWELPREAAAVRAQIGMVGHKPLVYDNLTARENLRFFGRLYGLEARACDQRASALLAQVGLEKRADDLVRTYSRGMFQRLSIARALLHQPDILLFDEPHTGLDQRASALLDDLMIAARGEGRTILFATHELERAAHVSTRLVVLQRGTVAHDGPSAGLDGAGVGALFAQKA
jgi:heme exporter protein A